MAARAGRDELVAVLQDPRVEPQPGRHDVVNVNGIPHQAILPSSGRRADLLSPYDRSPGRPLGDVLIIGAGSGNDVAIALAQGAEHVDAVEIDPRLYELGARAPSRPTLRRPAGRRSTSTTGARSSSAPTEQYDLILFALPDSLTLVSGQSSLRLESYLFTSEAIEAARDHLKPRRRVRHVQLLPRAVARRSAARARSHAVVRTTPCVETVGRQGRLAVLTAVPQGRRAPCKCSTGWTPTDGRSGLARHRRPPVPLLAGAIASRLLPRHARPDPGRVARRSFAWSAGPLAPMRAYTDLFFMGAAFLLLETKSVVQFALLFGTTWFVNALVFAGVLLSVLAAVEVARRVGVRAATAWLYLGAPRGACRRVARAARRAAAARRRAALRAGRGDRARVHCRSSSRTWSSPQRFHGRRRLDRGLRRQSARAPWSGGLLEYAALRDGLPGAADSRRRPLRARVRQQPLR